MFEKDYQTLNPQQKQVVNTLDQNLLVLAPAGTGKTKVMAMRSAHFIKHGVLPEQILCLTFTNKAAKEMQTRMGLYIPEAINQISVKTFHSFCYDLINHEKASSHFSFPCNLVDEVDSQAILQKIVEKNGINDEALFYPNLLRFFENIKRHSLTFPIEKRYAYDEIAEDYFKSSLDYGLSDRSSHTPFIKRFGLKLLKAYSGYLKESNCIDFMDLVVEAQYLLEQPEIQRRWQNRFGVIQIDEMQDTSCREYTIIKRLADKQLSLFGDFNQTIYEWRGSQPSQMTKDYRRDYHPLEIHLSINYRTTKTLLDAANDYIASSRLYPITCYTKATCEGEPITLLEAESKAQEINMLELAVKASKARGASIAVLTRTNEYSKKIAQAFMKANIPCTVIEDTKFFRRKEIKELLAFFEYSINDRNSHALLKMSEHPYLDIPTWLLNELRNTKPCYLNLHDWFRMETKDPYSPLFEAYGNNQIVVLDVEATGLSTLQDDIVQIAAIRYGKDGILKRLNVLLKPTKSVGNSYFIHGFSDKQLEKEGLDPLVALKELLDFIENCVIVGHNVNYDMQIISSMLSRYHLPAIKDLPVYDTLDLAYKVYPKLSNHKLDTLAKLIEAQTSPNHNAMQDILATSEVLTHLMRKIASKQQERLEKIEAYYCYVIEYKEKLNQLRHYLCTHRITESLTYLMNTCDFKDYYDASQLKLMRQLYRIAEFLEDSALSVQDNVINLLTFSALHYSEIEQSELFKDRIPIITVHQAKGLEFDEVYIAGCNDRVFPSKRSVMENKLTEEMRLFYVAMTRARKKLYISYHQEAKKSILVDKIEKKYKIVNRYGEMMSNLV